MIRILIVEDDFMVAKVHAGFVRQTPGFAVVGVAHTGADALAEARQLRPDLVLLDIHLPDISGLDLLQRLREAQPDLDALVISAAREVDTVRRALRGGIVHYLMKPFSGDDLKERLEHYRRTYHSLAESEGEAQQDDVNQVFGIKRASRPLPKGCSPETLQLVKTILREAPGDVSATEAAEQLGTSRVSARRYLEYLSEEGQVQVQLRYGGVGRPERRYLWRDGE